MIDFYIDTIEDLREIAGTDEDITYSEKKKVTAPQWMKYAAKRGLKIRSEQPESNRCCLPTGLRRANQIKNGETLSLSTLKRMKSFAARHGAQADWKTPEGKNAQALLVWGIPYSKDGLNKFKMWVDKKIAYLEND